MEGQTRLLVVDKETDEELRRRQLTCTEEMAQRGLPPALDPWEPKADWAPAGSLSGEAGQKVRRLCPQGSPGLSQDRLLGASGRLHQCASLDPSWTPGGHSLGHLEPLFLSSACVLNRMGSGQPGPGPWPPGGSSSEPLVLGRVPLTSRPLPGLGAEEPGEGLLACAQLCACGGCLSVQGACLCHKDWSGGAGPPLWGQLRRPSGLGPQPGALQALGRFPFSLCPLQTGSLAGKALGWGPGGLFCLFLSSWARGWPDPYRDSIWRSGERAACPAPTTFIFLKKKIP